MADKFLDVSILGERELQKKLQRVEIAMQRRIVKKAMLEGAEIVLRLARLFVPVRTGKLRDSLRKRALTGVRGAVGARVETGTRDKLGIAKDDPFFYPAIVEYKHQSYLRRAVDEDPETVKRVIARHIRAGIEVFR